MKFFENSLAKLFRRIFYNNSLCMTVLQISEISIVPSKSKLGLPNLQQQKWQSTFCDNGYREFVSVQFIRRLGYNLLLFCVLF